MSNTMHKFHMNQTFCYKKKVFFDVWQCQSNQTKMYRRNMDRSFRKYCDGKKLFFCARSILNFFEVDKNIFDTFLVCLFKAGIKGFLICTFTCHADATF